MRKDLIENDTKIDSDVTAKYEKAFKDKIRVWQGNEVRKMDYHRQKIDQKAMCYSKSSFSKANKREAFMGGSTS